MLLYHYCRSLEHIIYGEIKPNPKLSDQDFIGAYRWLEKEVGFYPMFLSVGNSIDDLWITGYDNNWKKAIGTKNVGRTKTGRYIQKNILRKKGEFPNEVLFSFENVEGVFNDYDYWHFVLNADYKNYEISDYITRRILKRSWSKSKWIKQAISDPGSVQLVTPKLYLPNTKRIWFRNKKTNKQLKSM